MKFYLPYVAFLLFLIFNLVFCSDWSHNGDSAWDDDDEEKLKKDKSLPIGIALPWMKTSRLNVSKIPKQFLVPLIKYKPDGTVTYFCKVTIGKKIKIIGQLNYEKQECTIPNQFPPLTGQISSIRTVSELCSTPTTAEWPVFEVLINARQFNLVSTPVRLRQSDREQANTWDQYMPARPIRAEGTFLPRAQGQLPPYPPPFLAFCDCFKDSWHFYFPGLVQEVSQNGTLAFYYGLYNVQQTDDCLVFVSVVLNTRVPPASSIGAYRQFYDL